MLKTALIAFVIGFGAGSLFPWVQSAAKSKENPVATLSGMPSIAEITAKATLKDLPIMEVKEPF